MKLFFVYPEITRQFRYADWLEVGVAAALLRRAGWEVGGFYWKSLRQLTELKRRFEEFAPDVTVTPAHPDQVEYVTQAHRQIQSQRPQTLSLVCGIWPTLAPEAVAETRLFDGLIRAEWEMALVEFANTLQRKGDYTTVRNVWMRKGTTDVHRIPIRFPADLHKLPDPERDLFPYRDILQINGGSMPIQASRSCPFHCGFCYEPVYAELQGRKSNPYRMRHAQSVLSEAMGLVHRYTPERFRFVDEVFPWDERWLEEFGSGWREYVGLPFTATSVSEVCTARVVEQLAEAGCDRIVLGVETGNEELRRRLSDRNVGNRNLMDLRRRLEDHGIELVTTNMIGVPGESASTLEETLKFNEFLDPVAIRARVYNPLPHTPVAEQSDAKRFEIITRKGDSVDPDACMIAVPDLPPGKIPETYDRLAMLDSLLRSRRHHRDGIRHYDVLAHYGEMKCRSPWNRGARLVTWRRGDEAREVLALRAPTEITFEFEAHTQTAFSFGITTEPTLKGLRPTQPIQFGIKLEQDGRIFRVFKKILIPAFDPDARRWHDYVFPFQDVKPGPCRLLLQVWVREEDLENLAEDEEIWGGWSQPIVLFRDASTPRTPVPVKAGKDTGEASDQKAGKKPGDRAAAARARFEELKKTQDRLKKLEARLERAEKEKEALARELKDLKRPGEQKTEGPSAVAEKKIKKETRRELGRAVPESASKPRKEKTAAKDSARDSRTAETGKPKKKHPRHSRRVKARKKHG
jgi:radical SAM superfamily enzyme YgiQ (UPF0313 family)